MVTPTDDRTALAVRRAQLQLASEARRRLTSIPSLVPEGPWRSRR